MRRKIGLQTRRSEMLNITVSGATGRMGTRIITLLLNIEDLKLANALERQGHK
ncbi:MAG TPA: hypothetical protein ENH45_03640, partial [Nitrospirae bacterium]|nr:hypothetical protein [Nitrospirota bacterium]